MSSTPTKLHPEADCCPDIVVPTAKLGRRAAVRKKAPKLALSPLRALLISAVGSVILVALSEERMGLEGISWVLLTVGAVAVLPLLKRVSNRGGISAFGLYSILILAHSAVFAWPLDLLEAQLVVALLGFAFMFYLKGSEMSIALVLSTVFFGSSVLSRGFDFSAETLGMPLVLTGVLGATAGAIGMTLGNERARKEKYRRFVESAPLPMWEVDLSGVQSLVQGIRAQGALAFCEHMAENADLLAEASRRMRVLSVNPLGKLLLPTRKTGSEVALRLDRPINRALMVSVLKGFWEGDSFDEIGVSFGEGQTAEHYRFSAYGDRLSEGDVNLVTVIASDVSEDKNHGADLERQMVDRERFVASIAHEIRTPLSTVVGLAQSILESPDMSDSERGELLDIMIRDGQDLSGIVEDLLVGARLDMGTLRIVLQDVVVRTEVDAVLAALGMKAKVAIGPGVALVGNRIRFRQVVRNMLTNAGRYGGSEVRVVYGLNGTTGFVEVRDNGTPIPVDQREKMFLAYERLHDRPGVTDSVGLGLPVSRSLARAMGGDLEYDHDGREAIFRVSLPVAKSSRLSIEVGTAV